MGKHNFANRLYLCWPFNLVQIVSKLSEIFFPKQDHHSPGLQHQHGQAPGQDPRRPPPQRPLPPVQRLQASPPGPVGHRADPQDGGAGGPVGRKHAQPVGQGEDPAGLDLRAERGLGPKEEPPPPPLHVRGRGHQDCQQEHGQRNCKLIERAEALNETGVGTLALSLDLIMVEFDYAFRMLSALGSLVPFYSNCRGEEAILSRAKIGTIEYGLFLV